MFTLELVIKFKKPIVITHDIQHPIVNYLNNGHLKLGENECREYELDVDNVKQLVNYCKSQLNKPLRPKPLNATGDSQFNNALMYRKMMADAQSYQRIIEKCTGSACKLVAKLVEDIKQ